MKMLFWIEPNKHEFCLLLNKDNNYDFWKSRGSFDR